MTPVSADLEVKEQALLDLIRGLRSVVIGYSGGVDSAYLAKAALDALGRDHVVAVTGRSPSYPAVQHEMALKVARAIGLPHIEIETGELDDPRYAANPTNRCYFCKADLYGRLTALARARGYEAVLDGSNADDRDDYRPGLAAAQELGVRSPLQEVGLTKAEIRELSRRAGLPTWDAPAAPCLASRIAYGLPVTAERLGRIEQAETRLRALHRWRDLRVRHHGELARAELPADALAALADPALRREVAGALAQAGFARAGLDLAGYRRGALNEGLAPAAERRRGSDTDRSREGQGGGREGCAVVPGPAEAERRLAALGLEVRVEAAGAKGEVALIRSAKDGAALLDGGRAAAVAACRAAGFRYVALEL